MRSRRVVEHRQEADAVERIVGVRRHARRLEEGRHPVHRDRELRGGAARRHARRPAHDVGHADAALEQVHLLADERPGVGEALAAVVAGEDHERVVRRAGRVERVRGCGRCPRPCGGSSSGRSATEPPSMWEILSMRSRLGLVVARLPGPVRRRVVHRQQERRLAAALPADEVDRALGDEIGEVAAAWTSASPSKRSCCPAESRCVK